MTSTDPRSARSARLATSRGRSVAPKAADPANPEDESARMLRKDAERALATDGGGSDAGP